MVEGSVSLSTESISVFVASAQIRATPTTRLTGLFRRKKLLEWIIANAARKCTVAKS
jgi:hypothetical protein